ncbi:TetR/AcrR family transcriptional regulator [Sphingomonas baiyangensis]|uniref:TetR/AcrR family transcriptional regulator n=1 Tax=Sphingomonas baiyangensis TaxID=2572576 RepID=A0A4U1L9L0_9SPHN|nr:TetR/AcrR family transcriptional regulator [Sphingomonas baiyangensis]TKD53125.1 TetR/AcrR family transcriptional regulator [Sphingomonas baiyangensis]
MPRGGKCAPDRKPRPGRPRDPAKRNAILAAAREAFLERGLAASTIEDIAQRAGVSKVTLYNRFGDKETLFEAVMRGELERMTAAFDLSADCDSTLEARLNLFGEGLLQHLFSADLLGFDRLLASEIAQVPALSERFFRAGPGLCRQRLAGVLADAAARGELVLDDASQAAEDLMSLWRGLCDVEIKFGLVRSPDAGVIRRRAAHGTRLFLRAYQSSHQQEE